MGREKEERKKKKERSLESKRKAEIYEGVSRRELFFIVGFGAAERKSQRLCVCVCLCHD